MRVDGDTLRNWRALNAVFVFQNYIDDRQLGMDLLPQLHSI
jgi:hypothetical protein